MKRERIVLIVGVSAIVVFAAAAGIYFASNPAAYRQVLGELRLGEADEGGISASGFIEAEEIAIGPEVGGRIAELLVAEGDRVEAGQVLVRIEETLAQAQVEVARAGLEVAQAALALAEAGARREQVRQAEAELAYAEAARDGAFQTCQDALALVDNPQDLNAQIILAEAQLAQADAGLRQAGLLRDTAQDAQNAYDGTMSQLEDLQKIPAPVRPPAPDLPADFYAIPYFYWKAWIAVNSAGAAYDGTQRTLSLLYEMRDEPHELQAQADAACAQYEAAEATVALARFRLEGLEAGATEEEIAALEAQVQQAEAQLDSALVLQGKLTLTSPAGGTVLDVVGRVGELAAPAATLVTVADLDRVTLTVYVPENQLGLVQLGQRVQVAVDSFPEQIFVGEVATIASEAEFTPRNVQTQEERVNMVFAVKVLIPNADHALKPGMPADAVILAQ